MATIRERLVYAIEVVSDRAQSGFKGLKQSVADADGAVGKFKAGANSALQSVQANAANLALAGGGALVAFGVKSVAAFQDTAIAAGKFSDATGLAVEDASRLIEVAGDVGIEVGTIEGAIAKMNQAAAKGDLGKFGVELQRTADGTVDVNATFLETIRVLNGIEDPTERALAAQKIFGRGYKEVAEVIFDSASNVEAKLKDVSQAKVIDAKELEKARKFRESMDNLKDSLEDIELAAGEALVPLLSDLADVVVAANDGKSALEDMVGSVPGGESFLETVFSGPGDIARDFQDNLRNLGEGLGIVGEQAPKVRDEIDRFNDSLVRGAPAADDAATAVDGVADEVVDLGDKAANAGPKIGDMSAALDDVADRAANNAAEALGRVAAAAQAVGDAVETAFEDIDARFRQQDVLADIADGWDDIAESAEEAMKGGADERRAYERDVRDQRRAVLDLLDSIEGLPPDKKIKLATEIEQGSLQTLHDIVNQLAGGITVPVSFQTQPGFTGVNGVFSQTQATPIINGTQNAIPSGNVTNIYPVGTTPTSAQQDLTTFYRRNGITRS